MAITLLFSNITKSQSNIEIEAEKYYRSGIEEFDSKKFKEAIENFDICIKLSPKSKYYYNRGVSYFLNNGQYERALEDLNSAINIDNNVEDYYFERGLIYQSMDNYVSCVIDYEKAAQFEKYKYLLPKIDTIKHSKKYIDQIKVSVDSVDVQFSSFELLENGNYKILYNNIIIGFIKLPSDIESFALYYQTAEDKKNLSRTRVKDFTNKKLSYDMDTTTFLKTLGAHFKYAEINNMRLLISATNDKTSGIWESNNDIKFGKSEDNMLLLKNVDVIYNGETIHFQGWINY